MGVSLNRLLATWFGLGYVPVAPGTAGSLGALPLVALLHLWGAAAATAGLLILVGAAVLTSQWMHKETGRKDPSEVVIDEVAGQVLALYLIPLTPLNMAAGFLLFRFFDILKPYPVRLLEKLPGGWGIVLDDLAAAVYSQICLRLILAWAQ